MSHLITGLDIGSFSTKVVVGRIKNDKIEVLGALKEKTEGFRKGALVDFEEALIFLRKIIVEIENFSKGAARNVYVNANAPNIKTYFSKGIAGVGRADNKISQDDIDRAIAASRAVNLPSNFMILHNINKEFLVDGIGDISNPLGMVGSRLEVFSLIIAAFAPPIKELTKALEKAGAFVSVLIFNPLASALSLLSKQQKDLGVVLVDIGSATTNLVIYEENKIVQANSFPLGGGNITNDIAIGLKIPIELAEKIKLMYGGAFPKGVSRKETINLSEINSCLKGEVSKRFLTEIIEARLNDIFEFVGQELKKINCRLPAGVVLSGGTAKFPGIEDLAKQELKLPVQLALPNLSKFDIKDFNCENLLNDSEFSLAVGLVLFGAVGQRDAPPGILRRILRVLKP